MPGLYNFTVALFCVLCIKRVGWKGYERFPIKFRWAILFYTKYQIPNTEGPFWRSCLEHASEISVNFHPSPNLGRVLSGRPPTSQKRGDHSEEAALKQVRGEDCDKRCKMGFTISHYSARWLGFSPLWHEFEFYNFPPWQFRQIALLPCRLPPLTNILHKIYKYTKIHKYTNTDSKSH